MYTIRAVSNFFATGVKDTGGKFSISFAGIETSGNLPPVSTILMEYSGAGGKLIHKKIRSKKSRDTVLLTFKTTLENKHIKFVGKIVAKRSLYKNFRRITSLFYFVFKWKQKFS